MARSKKDSKPLTPTRQRLTLAQLAAYDDILTDALVDHVSDTKRLGPRTGSGGTMV
jgi:hypothetical protein